MVDTGSRTAGIDPRIQARRDAVWHAHQRRRRRWRTAILATLVVVATGWTLTRTALLDVDRIDVTGAERTSVEDLLAVAGVSPGDQLLEIDDGAIRDRLTSLPWVAAADVDVAWRGDVTIHVEERRPVAMVSDAEGRPVLVDGEGRVLGPAVAPDVRLVPVDGVVAGAPGEVLPEPADDALAVVQALTPSLRSRVELVTVEPSGRMQLTVRPQGQVRFCGVDQLDAKIAAMRTVFAQVDDRGLRTLDVCVPEQPIVTRAT
jgi:cell division septal protein FtsQ